MVKTQFEHLQNQSSTEEPKFLSELRKLLQVLMKAYSNDSVPKPLKRMLHFSHSSQCLILPVIFSRGLLVMGGAIGCGWIELTWCCSSGVLRTVPDVRKEGSLFSVQVLIFCLA